MKKFILIILFFIVQTLVTGACCKLSAEKYSFRDNNCKIRTIDISYGKLLDSQKNCDDGWFIGKDPDEERIIQLFQNQKNRYSNGHRVDPESDTVYFYEYDRKTGTLTTYAKVCEKPEPYNYSNPELARISKELSEIEITDEVVKKDISNVLKSARKESK